MHSLKSIGWNNFFQQRYAALQIPEEPVARVVGNHRNLYVLNFGDGKERLAEVGGRFRFETESRGDFPVIGDWVVTKADEGGERSIITHLLPRQTALSRQTSGSGREGNQGGGEQIMAANVEIVFIVSSLNQDLNLRRLERYCIMAAESGARPVILLTKADLCDDPQAKVDLVKSVVFSTPVHAVSAYANIGLSELDAYLLPGQTSVLVGSSGIGKSTLINWLRGDESIKVQDIREKDGKGKHTTTHREMHVLKNGSLIIDNPGIRELQLDDPSEGIAQVFDDIAELEEQCRFNNCQHGNEPGCAIRTALEDGSLDQGRLNNYQKLSREANFLGRKDDLQSSIQYKKQQKERGKMIKKTLSAHKTHQQQGWNY